MVRKSKRKQAVVVERRKDLRVAVDADIGWTIDGTPNFGRLADMSMAGCFVLAAGEFSDGQMVRLYFPNPEGSSVEILSEIKNHATEIGFGVRFVDLTDFQKKFLHSFGKLHHVYRKQTDPDFSR